MSERQDKNSATAGWDGMQSPMAKAITNGEKNLGFSTLAVHGGEPRPKFGNSLATPIIPNGDVHFYKYPGAARSFSAANRA
jgi:hypothetical protein